ncbi:MAG: TlpA family protein disulfide reductase [Gammaproteobacteria bacterium]|nr:TlpA family protein disulfide reductase [Gammaproteobacteria bacterium]
MLERVRRTGARPLLFALLFGVVAQTATAGAALLGRPAPDFVLKDLAGDNVRLSEYRGRVVLLAFYARWAGDSRLEMPALGRIDTTYRRAGVSVLGVSVDADTGRAAEFARAMHVDYPLLLDGGARIGRAYDLRKIPLTILIDRSGIVRYVKAGYRRGDDHAFVAEIRTLLSE